MYGYYGVRLAAIYVCCGLSKNIVLELFRWLAGMAQVRRTPKIMLIIGVSRFLGGPEGGSPPEGNKV